MSDLLTTTRGHALTMDADFWEWIKAGGAAGVGIGGAAGTFGGILLFFRWMINFIAGRTDLNQVRMDKIRDELFDQQRADNAALRAEIVEITRRLDECHQQHLEAERKIAKLEAAALVPGMANQQAQQIIAANSKKERDDDQR